ncbi:cupin domain-containing protein [Solimicrobium silvestre]|uniref:Cupin domain n=1 Tax=Solimicrobium silvestre TaxID=2099400 RepID=A0A2S9H2L0_9BURK|nr:cupin domain-containing protein [Solimicrobium silvestre]PRC94222.1 Cupin domain [Solimicrobium silvestre]
MSIVSKPANSMNSEGVFEPFPIADVPWEEFAKGQRFGMRFQHLSSYGGATQIGVANEVLLPGKQANPAHYHMLEEEHVFILEGALTLRLGDKAYIMSAGQYVCFPAGQKQGHALFNHTDVACRYLIIGNTQANDVAVHTETGRVAVKLMGVGYSGTATMDYWDSMNIDE